MGRGPRRAEASAAGGALRGSAGGVTATAPEKNVGLQEHCKTDNQRVVYGIVHDLSAGGRSVELGDIMERAIETIDEPREVTAAIAGMTAGLGWEDSREGRTRGPLLRLDESSAAKAKIIPVSKDYYQKNNFLAESTPYGYADFARRTRDRNVGALQVASSEAEKAVVRELIERTPFDSASAIAYHDAAQLQRDLEDKFSRQEVHAAMLALHEKTVISFDETDGARIRLLDVSEASGPDSDLGRRNLYREQFGQEKFHRRFEEIQQCNSRAMDLVEGDDEETVATYLRRRSPYWEDDRISYSDLSRDMEPLMSRERLRSTLERMSQRGIIEATDNANSGKNFELSPQLAVG